MLTFLTGNSHKLSEARAILGDHIQPCTLDLPEIQSLDPTEIIQHKIQTAITSGGVEWPFFVEDTSLVFHVLGQFPWPLIKRVLRHEWAMGAYRLLTDYDDHSASAICHIGYRDGSQTHFVSGSVQGTIVPPQGETDFGRDPIFMPSGHDQTFGQMTSDQKNAISHRKRALEKLLQITKNLCNPDHNP